jgi:hypothetical protein
MAAPPRTARWTVTCDSEGLATCRQTLGETLTAWGFGECVFEAQLLVSELIRNAAAHADCTTTDVSVGADDDAVRIAVWDTARDRIPVLPSGPGRDDRFGLRIVTAAAPRWGVTVYERGKRVWFELDRTHADLRDGGRSDRRGI